MFYISFFCCEVWFYGGWIRFCIFGLYCLDGVWKYGVWFVECGSECLLLEISVVVDYECGVGGVWIV